jgi:hypothetical protein
VKFYPPGSNRQVNVNVYQYMIDWDRRVSGPQKAVKEFLYPYWLRHVVLEEFTVPKTRWRMDLLNLTRKIAVEVSPGQHQKFNPFFHKNRFNFGASLQRDIKKQEWAEKNGFTFVEIYQDDIECLSPKWFLDTYGITL